MNRRVPSLLTILLAVLTVTAGTLVAVDGVAAPSNREQTEALQQLVGGLGCGPAVDLSRCAFSFDPRLCAECPLNHGPVPGGVYFCPQHACSILYCPPLAAQSGRPGAETNDGRAP